MTVPVFELNAKVIIPNNTAGVNSAMNQSGFSSISRDFLKGREKSCVQGEGEYIWFCFSLVAKLTRDFKRSNRNHIITFRRRSFENRPFKTLTHFVAFDHDLCGFLFRAAGQTGILTPPPAFKSAKSSFGTKTIWLQDDI